MIFPVIGLLLKCLPFLPFPFFIFLFILADYPETFEFVMKWRTLPMPRLLLPMVVGVGVGNYCILPWAYFQQLHYWGFGILVLLVLSLAFRPGFRDRTLFGVLLFFVLGSLGFFRIKQCQFRDHSPHFLSKKQGDSLSIWGEVLEAKPSQNSFRVLLRVKAQSAQHTVPWEKSSGKLLAYLKIPPETLTPQIGQHILLSGLIEQVKPPFNPDAFDFRAYLARKGVYHQLFAPEGAWQVDTMHQQRSLPLFLQGFCLKTLEKYLPPGNTRAVGAALILGERSELSQEIQQVYSNSGAVHVLSVSGLHVGVLAIVLRFVFGFWSRNKYAQKLGLSLELGSIWVFTLLTGAAPATLRAAVMFSMIIGARSVIRQYNIWNILAASAFVLLCWDPRLLWDIGFQLSYLAIAGIVAFQPWIYQRWIPPNLFWDYLWKLSSVGFAAQLSTGPLSIFYFHQFPVYFWLSGLIAVPLSGIILMLGLGLFLLEALHIPAAWLGQVLNWAIQLLNGSIVAVQDLPRAVMSGFWWNELATLGMYAILILLGIALSRRKLIWLNTALVLLTIWGGAQWPGQAAARKQQVLICYQVPKASMMDLVQGQELLCLSNAAAQPALMAAQNHRYHRQIKTIKKLEWQYRFHWGAFSFQGHFLHFGRTKIGVVDGEQGFPVGACDVLLLRNNPRIYPEDLQPKPKLMVLDGSNHAGTRRWVGKLASELEIAVHDTAKQGAWILSL